MGTFGKPPDYFWGHEGKNVHSNVDDDDDDDDNDGGDDDDDDGGEDARKKKRIARVSADTKTQKTQENEK